jgi:hypothetical protein
MNKDWSWNNNNKNGQIVIFRGGERKEKKMTYGDKPGHHRRHAW